MPEPTALLLARCLAYLTDKEVRRLLRAENGAPFYLDAERLELVAALQESTESDDA